MSRVDDKINEYAETFNESLPVFSMPLLEDGDLIALIDKCIEDGKPYRPKIKPDVLY